MWQDSVFLLGNLMFGFFLIPQIRDVYYKKTKLNMITCATTITWLAIFGVTYATLGFWLAVLGDFIDVGAWALLLGLSISNARR